MASAEEILQAGLEGDKIIVAVQDNAEFALAPFDDDEYKRWRVAIEELFWNSPGILRQLIETNRRELLAAALAAKQSLRSKTFGGFSAKNTELGVSKIRPGHVGMTSNAGAGKPNNIWKFFFNQGSYDNWLGAAAGADNTGFTMGASMFISKIAAADLGPSPVADEWREIIGRVTLLPLSLRELRTPDVPGAPTLNLAPLPKTYWPNQESVTVRIYSDAGGWGELVPLGLTYGLGTVLNNLTYTEALRTA